MILAKPQSDKKLEFRLRKQIRRMREDAVYFVRKAIGVEPTGQQAMVLNAISKPGAKVSVRSGHGTGKSTSAAWEILRTVLLFPNCKVPCTAPTGHQLEDVLWSEISKWHQKMHPWFRDQVIVDSSTVYAKDNRQTQFAVARTARKENPEALQGFHADNLLFVIDEASGIPDPIFEVAQGALSTDNVRVLMLSNPTQTTGYFFQSHHRNKHRWECLKLSCADSPLVSADYIRDMREDYGEDSDVYRVRVLGDFPVSAIAQLITRQQAEGAQEVKLNENSYGFAPKILGVDVAWEGDDRSCVFLRQGLASWKLGEWHNIDNMTLGGLIAQWEDEHKTDATFIDVGWGTGVIDYLRSIGRDPVPVNFGGKSISEEYDDKRTEIWCEMKKWLESGGHLPRCQDLVEDLVGPDYFFTGKGKKKLESKKAMKKRGLSSPDLADALALTFAAPVYKREDLKRTAQGGSFGCNTEYNVLEM